MADRYDTVLLDCLTLWVSNLLLRDGEDGAGDADIPARSGTRCWRRTTGERPRGSWSATRWGWGWCADKRLGRLYTDELGRANQIVAAAADDVFFMAAGLPLNLKRPSDSAD